MSLQVSFEFFPPRTETGLDNLIQASQVLNQANPSYYSVTFGAFGSTQDTTLETCLQLQEKLKTPISPHISCIGTSKNVIKKLLDEYKEKNINHLVVLRGDIPSGMVVAHGDFAYATDLVKWIRQEYGDFFHIAIACYPEIHPQSLNAQKDFHYFKEKVSAGANEAITQYFYNPDSYMYFLDRCKENGIDIPITPGIMPITNYHQLARFSSMCGAEIPRWIRKQLESVSENQDSLISFGLDVVTNLCETLIKNGAPGLHFYTLNKSQASIEICKRLKLV